MPDEAEVDMDIDTTTLATDRECLEIEAKARTRKVLHWPELVRMINRLRAAEKERDKWREMLADLLSWFPEKPEWHLAAGEYGADDAVAAARAALEAKP